MICEHYNTPITYVKSLVHDIELAFLSMGRCKLERDFCTFDNSSTIHMTPHNVWYTCIKVINHATGSPVVPVLQAWSG